MAPRGRIRRGRPKRRWMDCFNQDLTANGYGAHEVLTLGEFCLSQCTVKWDWLDEERYVDHIALSD